jgi:hypothetical protein
VDAQFRQFFSERLKKQRCDLTALKQSAPAPVMLADALPKADTSLDLDGLRHIIRLAKQKGIELTLFAYPKHALWLELDAVCGAYQSYWSGLAAIASLVEQEGGKTELWEFTRYNDMTAEIITKNSAVYWQDPEHFNYEFGNMIFDAIYKHQPESNLGSRITTQNISHAYQQYLASRNAYFGTHQNMLTSLRKQLY